MIFNIDTLLASSTHEINLMLSNIDEVLRTYYAPEPKFSIAELDNEGFVLKTVEIEVISSNALTGIYHIKKSSDFFEVAESSFNNNKTTKGEFYIALLYKHIINKGKRLIIDIEEHVNILGTTAELQLF